MILIVSIVNAFGKLSSNTGQGCLYSLHIDTLGKGMNSFIPAMGKLSGLIVFTSHGGKQPV